MCCVQTAVSDLSAMARFGDTSLSVTRSDLFLVSDSIRLYDGKNTTTETHSTTLVVATPLRSSYRAGTIVLKIATQRVI